MTRLWRNVMGCSLVVTVSLTASAGAQMKPSETAVVPGILPSGFGESVDRDVAKARAATARFKAADQAIAAGYAAETHCVENPPHGAMGFHFNNGALRDATLDPERPEVLVYEKMSDGTFKLNGVEYVVPIAAWTREEPPMIMTQKLKRADSLGIWYLHVWIWEPSPTGMFADWNPRVKC
jgi:hypothetical protein